MKFSVKMFLKIWVVKTRNSVIKLWNPIQSLRVTLFEKLMCCFISWLVKMLQPQSLYEVIVDILLFVLNTKQPLSDIWLSSCEQNSFGCFFKKLKLWIFRNHPKLFRSQLGNQISLRGHFVFKTNGRISSITSYKPHCCSFFKN